jgi:PAS domain-containing protein
MFYALPIASNKTSNPYVLLENILDTAIVINDKGAIQYFNKRAEAFFGYNRSETLGRNVKMLMPSPFADEHDSYLTNYLSTGEAKVRCLLLPSLFSFAASCGI